MPIGRVLLKATALISSVTLFAGFVAFRAGALNGFVTAARSPTDVSAATSSSPYHQQEFDFGSQDQEHSFNAEFFPEPTVMHSSKGGGVAMLVKPSVVSNSTTSPTVMYSSKAGIGIVIPSFKLGATSDNDPTAPEITSGVTIEETIQLLPGSDDAAQARFHALAGSKTIVNVIQPADLAIASKPFANTVPKKSKPTDITPLFQNLFSKHQAPAISPIVSTKSAVLDWSPPVMLFEQVPVHFDQTPTTKNIFDEASSSATAPQSPAKKQRRAVLSGSKSFVIPTENTLK